MVWMDFQAPLLSPLSMLHELRPPSHEIEKVKRLPLGSLDDRTVEGNGPLLEQV